MHSVAPDHRWTAGACRQHGVSDKLRNKKETGRKNSNSRPECHSEPCKNMKLWDTRGMTTCSFLNLEAVHWWLVHSGFNCITGDVFNALASNRHLFSRCNPVPTRKQPLQGALGGRRKEMSGKERKKWEWASCCWKDSPVSQLRFDCIFFFHPWKSLDKLRVQPWALSFDSGWCDCWSNQPWAGSLWVKLLHLWRPTA